ncbi:hypothetical protein PVAP13_3KG516003 [Panicum virgatum]|uniref:Uncharacterized protein n=1 Tax=Panicum virgatum TaxID=38727 RepID=A0A8T0V9M6_PANVG|nr:hypothetical protein PVAP13_3KG516003 [Panicum virgatum]
MRLQSPECSVRHRSDEEGCLTNHKGPRWGVDGNKCDRAGPALVQSRGLSSQARERSHHWRPSRRQICIREPRSHPSRTTRNCQSGRALGRTRPPCCVGNAGEITQEVTSNSVKPAPPRLNACLPCKPPTEGTVPCPGAAGSGCEPDAARATAPTAAGRGCSEDPLRRDPTKTGPKSRRSQIRIQPRRRSAGVARPPPAAGLPCGKTPRGSTAVACGRRRRRPRSCAGGPVTWRRRLARRECRTRDLRLCGHRIRQTHLKPTAIAGHWRDLPDPREPRPYARKGPRRCRPRRDADFRTPAQAAARCGRGWEEVGAVLAWVPPVSPLGGGRREGLGGSKRQIQILRDTHRSVEGQAALGAYSRRQMRGRR